MKKRLLITSIVMMLVVAVALSTATYAWFTSNTQVEMGTMTLKAATSDADALGIGWLNDKAGTSIESDLYDVLKPMAPESLTVSTTTSDVLFSNATVREEESIIVFNNDVKQSYKLTSDVALDPLKTYYTKSGGYYTAVASPVVDNIGTYYEKNFAPIVYKNGTNGTQAFYVKNLSPTNTISSVTVHANFSVTNAYILTKDTTFRAGSKYYKKNNQEQYVLQTFVDSDPSEDGDEIVAGAAVTEDTYYESVNGDDLVRVAIFTKAKNVGTNNTATNYTLLGVLGKTATAYRQVTENVNGEGDEEYSLNKIYYTENEGEYTVANIEAFAEGVTYYVKDNTAAYGNSTSNDAAVNKFNDNDAVKALGYYDAVATSLTLATNLEAQEQVDIVAIAWLDGTLLDDSKASVLGQVGLYFTAA